MRFHPYLMTLRTWTLTQNWKKNQIYSCHFHSKRRDSISSFVKLTYEMNATTWQWVLKSFKVWKWWPIDMGIQLISAWKVQRFIKLKKAMKIWNQNINHTFKLLTQFLREKNWKLNNARHAKNLKNKQRLCTVWLYPHYSPYPVHKIHTYLCTDSPL